jgi:hypothetical protein
VTEPRDIPGVLLRQPASRADQSPSDRPLKIAQADRDHVARLLADHYKTCHDGALAHDGADCETCVSLQAHADRTERQVALLTPEPGPEPESLF